MNPLTQSLIALITGLAILALTLMIVLVVAAIVDLRQQTDTAEQAELARLTAPLPPEQPEAAGPVYVGRHFPEHVAAIGTEAQRRLHETMPIDLAEVAEAVAAVTG